MNRASLIDEVFDNLQSRITDSVSWLSDYVFVTEVVVVAIVCLSVLAVAGYFVPFDGAKKFFGYLGSLIIAGVAGVFFMFRHTRGENKHLRDEISELKKRQPEDKSSGWHF